MSNQEAQKQAVLDRINTLHTKVGEAAKMADYLLTTASEDAARMQLAGLTEEFKIDILTGEGIVGLTRLKNELDELNSYYAQQKQMLEIAMNQPEEKPAITIDLNQQAQELARTMRERAAQLAAQPVAPAPAAVEEAPATELKTEALGLPIAEPVEEAPAKPALPTLVPVPENSLERLVSKASPLLDIFAPGPWLPEGRGTVTVGSYQWYKSVNPLEKNELDRAKLPTGFYGGDARPAGVLLRMETCIIYWTFGLDFEAMTVFMVGLSNADPNNLRWFKPQELSASYTRRLVTELAKEAAKQKTA
jgi:hypothetical protein